MPVHEWMTREVLSVGPETPVSEIVKLLASRAVSGLPVVDGGRLVGIVSEGDLIMREKPVQAPAAIAFLGALLFVNDFDRTKEELRRHAGASARDVMTSPVVTVRPDAEVSEAAALMVDKDVKRLPVVQDGRLVGILTRKDLVRALLKP